jgi:hypothetical protein
VSLRRSVKVAELRRRLGREPGNRARVDVVATGDVAERFAPVAAANRFAPLVRGELRRSAHVLPARHGSRPTFAGARAD